MTAAGEQYAARRADLFELIRSLPDEAMSMAVPATPGWSVHDVVSHLAGVAADNVRGALPDDERMPTLDAWTSRQVAERADTPTADVLSEWEESSAAFEALIDRDGRSLPAALIDLVTHYDDLKHAVGYREKSTETHLQMMSALCSRWVAAVDKAGLPSLLIMVPTGDPYDGEIDAPVVYRSTPTFIYRASMGRKSRPQILRRFNSGKNLQRYVDELCIFPPSANDLPG